MEISFENRETAVYREFFRQSRRTQENAECVVPDTDADIEKIAAVQSAVFLKSKDLTGRGVLISGEAAASVLYIREGQEGLSCLRLRKPFSIEYEVEELESDALAQVSLLIQGTDVRVVNPRKISVAFEVEGELRCYRSEKLLTETSLPLGENLGLHARAEERSFTLPNAVCEKSVALNEQFVFPVGKPGQLVSERAELLIGDCQLIGSKIIVKGSAEITVCALAEDAAEPMLASFSAPFSQILDVGTETMAFCTVQPEITGAYFDLVDTVNGEKALDMELHAVLQLVSRGTCTVRYITDVYSNLMPAELISEPCAFEQAAPPQKRQLSASERLSLAEDCGTLLGAFCSLSRVGIEGEKLSAAVNLDFLYRGAEGRLSAGRRTLTVSGQAEGEGLRVLGARLAELSARPDGEYVDCGVTLELNCQSCRRTELQNVSGVILSEDRAYATETFPSLTLVRPAGESLWALARTYHSSEEAILAMNPDAESCTHMLMIPKCL